MNIFSREKSVLWFQMDPSTMRAGAFRGSLSVEGMSQPIIGVLASERGIAFIAQKKIINGEVDLRFTLREHEIQARVRIVSSDEIDYQGKKAFRFFCEFVGIKTDDWDMVVRHVKNIQEPPQAAKAIVANDEDFRVLPTFVQEKIVMHLVKNKKIAAQNDGRVPLMRHRVLGSRTLEDGRTLTDISIHSRIIIDHVSRQYDTHFRIHSDGKVEPA